MWLAIFLVVNYYLTSGGRAEDSSRALIVTAIPLSILAGVAAEKIQSGIKTNKTGKYVAILFILLLLTWSVYTTNTKAQSLKPIKQFSQSFFQGCDWIKQNAEEGALIVTLWQHRAEYACKRDTLWVSDPWIDKAVLAKDRRTTEIFKLHGADYIFIQKFSIKQGNEGESYPLDFVNYITNSSDYKIVYETEPNCLSKGVADCSLVYKIL